MSLLSVLVPVSSDWWWRGCGLSQFPRLSETGWWLAEAPRTMKNPSRRWKFGLRKLQRSKKIFVSAGKVQNCKTGGLLSQEPRKSVFHAARRAHIWCDKPDLVVSPSVFSASSSWGTPANLSFSPPPPLLALLVRRPTMISLKSLSAPCNCSQTARHQNCSSVVLFEGLVTQSENKTRFLCFHSRAFQAYLSFVRKRS